MGTPLRSSRVHNWVWHAIVDNFLYQVNESALQWPPEGDVFVPSAWFQPQLGEQVSIRRQQRSGSGDSDTAFPYGWRQAAAQSLLGAPKGSSW